MIDVVQMVLTQRGQDARDPGGRQDACAPRDGAPRSGAAWRWKKIADVAVEIGVSAQFIRNAINDVKHPLPWEKKAGEWSVKPGEAYDWACAHAKRRPPNLVKPGGYDEPARAQGSGGAGEQGSNGCVEALSFESVDTALTILERAYNTPGLSGEERRSMAALASAVRLWHNDKHKRAQMTPNADVVEMIRSFGELVKELVEERAEPLTLALLAAARDHLDTDLGTLNPAAKDIFKNTICADFAQHFHPSIQRKVREQVDGVEVLELGGEA